MKPHNENSNMDAYWAIFLAAIYIILNSYHSEPVYASSCISFLAESEQPCAIGLQIEEQIP